MEAAELGIFMISAASFTILLFHPASPVVGIIASEFLRRALTGIAMGLTAIALIYSPWGKQSGAHMNPAVTLTFWKLGKVAGCDACFYIIAQFTGAASGILLMNLAASKLLSHPAINFVATLPGAGGITVAFCAEAGISFLLIAIVLLVSNIQHFAKYTGLFAGSCVALFITFEAPLSGMSMNPARSFGSALLPHLWNSLWIYFLAPPVGMLFAAAAYQSTRRAVACAKLHHHNSQRCIFCEYQQQKADPVAPPPSIPANEIAV
jgi:aquaporin Z